MEPQIQYVKTSDGVNIAYCVQGQGPPLLLMPVMMGDIAGETELDDMVRWHERIGRTHTLVRYDPRGSGSSDRDALLDSFDAWFHDADAVADVVPFDQFDILATNVSSPAAILYAARRPDRVNRLILWHGFVRGADHTPRIGIVATRALIEKDWRTYTNAWAQTHFGWSNAEQGKAWARYFQRATGPENILAHLRAIEEVDLTELLPRVRAKTLLVDHRVPRINKPEAARFIATALSDSRLVVREGSQVPPWAERGGVEGAAVLIDEFLGVKVGPAPPEPQLDAGDVHTILFTDVEGSTALIDRLGDDEARELLREHERITREALAAHGGSEVKTMGDGFMMSFGSATKALECAIAIQRSFTEHNDSADEPINVRIGLNAGEPIAEDDPGGRGDLFGTAVNMAARIAAKAEGGEILTSNVVRELVAGKNFLFNDRGETELRGFEDPVRLFEVRWSA